MSKLRVESFMVSVDGFSAGPNQSLDNPLGEGGQQLGNWFFPTRTFQSMIGKDTGTDGVDNSFAARGFQNIGANIMGRNMFGPQRGPWADHDWKGWWGEDPPYHSPVFVMTHHPRPQLPMAGGTIFDFTSGPPHEVLARARAAANGRDVRLNGGTQIVRTFLLAGLVDHLHLAVSPVLLGAGERLLDGISLADLGLRNVETVPGEGALHLVYGRG
jgi:dihydrofolate reductase